MPGRSFVSAADFSRTEVLELLATAKALKADPRGARPLDRRVLAMIFEKPSLRTRVSFETGMVQLGGATINLAPSDIRMGAREAVADVARVMGRLCDGIMARVFAHDTVVQLATHAGVPVINGLSDLEHPCQALADFLTIDEHKDLASQPVVAYVGDGNNVCHSLLLLGEILGLEVRVGCPPGYEPAAEIVARCPRAAVTNDPRAAVAGADVVYTDVWASMGQEDSAAERRRLFRDYQVNEALFALAAPQAIFLHCLPAHRGEEVTDQVLDGPQSQVLDQAENRLHAQKAVLATLLTA
ncbi:MAG: ornithine carbamoyltransferase [Fimbriimonadaceae bacterium]|nr:ornithine carbamoyltransferase [Fimbriimonadaceae bacterium]